MVARAIALTCPDWDGAVSGANPFLIYADKSNLAIGAGLMQRPPVDERLPARLRDQIRPLGMMSKSLDATQQGWTVWEGELYALREALHHFRSIVGGCHIVLSTDHLNNILVSAVTELRQPQKILLRTFPPEK